MRFSPALKRWPGTRESSRYASSTTRGRSRCPRAAKTCTAAWTGAAQAAPSAMSNRAAAPNRRSILAGALGGLFLWFSLAQRFRRPMRDVLSGIRQVASGDLKHRIPTRTRDEFGEMAGSFNAMSEQLDALKQRLIQSVRLVSQWE